MSWSTITTLPAGGFTALSNMAGSTLYSANTQSDPRMRKSINGGVSWSNLGFSTVGIQGITISKTTGKVFAAGNPASSIWVSADQGESWSSIAGTGGKDWYDLSSDDAGNLYGAAYGGYLYRSTDGGATWTQMGSAAGWVSISSIAGILFAVQYGGTVLKSSDGGSSWSDAGWPARSWFRVRGSSSRIFAIEAFGNTYMSTDGGATWVDLLGPATGMKAFTLVSETDALFGSLSGVLYKYGFESKNKPVVKTWTR